MLIRVTVDADVIPYNPNVGIPVLRKPLVENDATRVHILASDVNLPDGRSIVGTYTDNEGLERLITFKADGTYLPNGKESDLDLVSLQVNI